MKRLELVAAAVDLVEDPGDPVRLEKWAGGQPLSPSVREWCARVGTGDVVDPTHAETFLELVERELGAAQFFEGFAYVLGGDCYALPGGSDSRRFVYVGAPDEEGEHPVMCLDIDDEPFVCVYTPSFAEWLGEEHDLLSFRRKTYASMYDHPEHGAATMEAARRNLGGTYQWLSAGDDAPLLPGATPPPGKTRGRNPFTGKIE